jgi:hypothetical protein
VTTTPTAPLTLDAAPEQLKVVAYLVTGLSSGEPSICFEDERGDYGDEDHMPVFDALCSTAEAQSALSTQAATIAQLEARLREAEERLRRSRDAGLMLSNFAFNMAHREGRTLSADDCASLKLMYERWDAAIAAHGKDGAHD